MKQFFLVSMLSLTLLSCERQDQVNNPSQYEDSDNTGRNVRDRNSMTTTPFDQSETEEDRRITQKVRQALMSDDSLSTNAKNIKVITVRGVVTLRGPVGNSQEKDVIVRKVKSVQGVNKVDNQLETSRNSY